MELGSNRRAAGRFAVTPFLKFLPRAAWAAVVLALSVAVACRDSTTLPAEPELAGPPSGGRAVLAADSATVIVAGDIHASCNNDFNKSPATAALVARYPGALVFVLGDNAGIHGTAAEYQCYDKIWGRFKARTYAVMGNHELNIDTTATAHYDYFNGVGVDSGAAGHRSRAYYTVTYGGWRLLVVNSQQYHEEQTAWITRELTARPARCVMALWHTPLFTSSREVIPAPARLVRPFWQALYAAGADVIIGGHSHQYERFAKTDWRGTVDLTHGIRHFVVGTGGGILMRFGSTIHPASRKRIMAYGVLKLTLWPDRYAWQFIDIGGRVLDQGRSACR